MDELTDHLTCNLGGLRIAIEGYEQVTFVAGRGLYTRVNARYIGIIIIQ